jgi:alkanesulfonate monooxygenase SsuD/methylene tetrahydromethanopterin reductase-like flavin-dependent oxidoreductase (luciferase family)
MLIGVFGPAAPRRIAQWGDGFIGAVVDPATASEVYEQAAEAWRAVGRPGKPRFVMGLYYALGQDAAERGSVYLRGEIERRARRRKAPRVPWGAR